MKHFFFVLFCFWFILKKNSTKNWNNLRLFVVFTIMWPSRAFFLTLCGGRTKPIYFSIYFKRKSGVDLIRHYVRPAPYFCLAFFVFTNLTVRGVNRNESVFDRIHFWARTEPHWKKAFQSLFGTVWFSLKNENGKHFGAD